jgi:hypothetical protein
MDGRLQSLINPGSHLGLTAETNSFHRTSCLIKGSTLFTFKGLTSECQAHRYGVLSLYLSFLSLYRFTLDPKCTKQVMFWEILNQLFSFGDF